MGLTVFAIYAFFTSVSALSLFTHRQLPPDTGFFHYLMIFGAVVALFLACSLFRDAKCMSEKVILVCLIGGIVLGATTNYGLVPSQTSGELKLGFDFTILLSIVTDLRVAYRHE